ncbi:MAG: saccharopine dehydrogenase family protein [Chlamydiota bacterium]|nr:saccharopine dehydrogenase family protein [Chlamydiota bacterium]
MGSVLIIGAGAAGSVVVKKCAKHPEVFEKIHLASRTLDKCRKLQLECASSITISQIDADDPSQVYALLEKIHPDLVINMALPYQDLSIMDACLKAGVHYMDTANYEPPDEAKFCYKWQWDYQERFSKKGIMALLGCGFDPGVTNVFCAYAQKELFDEIHTIDIVDCNAGDHGHPFATNFNPEINIREITQPGKYFRDGQWVEINPMSVSRMIDFPTIGPRKAYLLYHEELESLANNIKNLKRIRFWMTFSENYLTHLRVLQNIGITRIDPVDFEGHQIIPLKFLKVLLPDPSSLGVNYKGKTCIGCVIEGIKDGKAKRYFIYNICNHEEAYKEVQAQAVSYTTGVPAFIGAMMILQGEWKGNGVFNVEEMDPYPFMQKLNQYGLPWMVKELEHDPNRENSDTVLCL